MLPKVIKNETANKGILADLDLIPKKQAAAMLNVSTSTLDRYVKKGLIKYNKLGENVQQGRVYFHSEDIMAFKSAHYGFKK